MSKQMIRSGPAPVEPLTSAPGGAPSRLDPLVSRFLSQDLKLREAALDLFQNFGVVPLQDLSFQVGDFAGNPGGGSFLPPWYQLNTKRGELLPVYRTEVELRAIRDRSRILCYYNPFAVGAISKRVNYAVGDEGLTITVKPRKGYEDDPEAKRMAAEAQGVLDVWAEVNALPELQAECMKRLDEEGEFFVRRFPDENGIDHLRLVQPEHVTSPAGGDMFDAASSFGVETPADDVETVEGYWVVENPTESWAPRLIDQREIVHVTLNGSRDAKRGLPTFLPVEANLRRCEDLLVSLTSVAKARAKIALIRKLTGVTSTTAEALLGKLTGIKATDPATGEDLNIERLRPGTVLTTGANSEYQMPSATLGAADFVEVLQAELRTIASRLDLPEWMFSAMADAKYSNAFVVESPALKAFRRLQRLLTGAFGTNRYGHRASLAWRQLKQAVASGLLDADTLKCVEVECKGPSLETRDKASEALTNKTLNEMGVKSKKTIQVELGLDPDAQRKQLDAERPETERAQPQPGAVVQVQEAFYAGQLPRPAACASLQLLFGFTREQAEALLPIAKGVKRTDDGQQPGLGGPGVPAAPTPGGTPGGGGDGPGGGDSDSLGGGDDGGADMAGGSVSGVGGASPLASLLKEQRRRFRAGCVVLREAGFTGDVTASNGAVFHYVNGRRVARSTAAAADFDTGSHPPDASYSLSGLRQSLGDEGNEPGVFAKAKRFAVGVHRAVYGALVRATPTVMAVLPEILDTPQDFAKLGYNPALSGVGPQVADPVKAHLGISTHLALSIASRVLARAYLWVKKRSVREQFREAAGQKWNEVVDWLHGLLTELAEAGGAAPPDREAVDAWLRAKAGSGDEPALAETVQEQLREAGFTGKVVDRRGRVYYYEDGKRVKGHAAVEKEKGSAATPADKAASDEAARAAHRKAVELHEKAAKDPLSLTKEDLADLPRLLAHVPQVKLKEMAAAFKATVKAKLKDEHVAAVAALFPVPPELAKKLDNPPAPTQNDVTSGNVTQTEGQPVSTATAEPAAAEKPKTVEEYNARLAAEVEKEPRVHYARKNLGHKQEELRAAEAEAMKAAEYAEKAPDHLRGNAKHEAKKKRSLADSARKDVEKAQAEVDEAVRWKTPFVRIRLKDEGIVPPESPAPTQNDVTSGDVTQTGEGGKVEATATATDPLDLDAASVRGVWEKMRDEIANHDPKMSPAQAGSIAAARILNATRKRVGDYTAEIDARVRNGESITDAEDEKYIAAGDKVKELSRELERVSGYRPHQTLDEHPLAQRPLDAEPLPNNVEAKRAETEAHQKKADEVAASAEARRLKLTPVRGRIDWDGTPKEDPEGGKTLYRDPDGNLHASVNAFKTKQKAAAEQAKAERQAKDQEATKAAAEQAKQKDIEDRTARTKANIETVSRHFHNRLKAELTKAGLGDVAKRVKYRVGGSHVPDDAPEAAVRLRNELIGKYHVDPSASPEDVQKHLGSLEAPTPPSRSDAKAAEETAAPPLETQAGTGRPMFPGVTDPHVDKVPDADVSALLAAVRDHPEHGPGSQSTFADVGRALGWPRNRLAYALAAARKKGLVRLASDEGASDRDPTRVAGLLYTEPEAGSREHYGLASLSPAGREAASAAQPRSDAKAAEETAANGPGKPAGGATPDERRKQQRAARGTAAANRTGNRKAAFLSGEKDRERVAADLKAALDRAAADPLNGVPDEEAARLLDAIKAMPAGAATRIASELIGRKFATRQDALVAVGTRLRAARETANSQQV